jgi:hypothetical protein
MRRFDYEAITYAIRLGGKLGLVWLGPSSILLTLHALFGDVAVFGIAEGDDLARWVRLGLEIFLAFGWAFGAIEMARQTVARLLGPPAGVLMGGATGTLVIHAFAVFFILIAPDAPPLGAVALGGTAISFAAASWLGGRRHHRVVA